MKKNCVFLRLSTTIEIFRQHFMKKWLLIVIGYLITSISYANPLPAAEVFQVAAKRIDPNTFTINWLVKPGYFLYSDRIKLIEQADNNLHLGSIRFPETLKKIDQRGHSYPVYRNQLSIPVAVLGEQPGEALIKLYFQGCADSGFCYPPEIKPIKLTIGNDLALTKVYMEKTPMLGEMTKQQPTAIETIFVKQHGIITILSFFGFGLLLAFTPCVLPMIPVLSGIIIGSENLSTRKAFFLSLSYVLSMAATYAVVGALVASLGSNLQIAMQSPWAISLFSFIFVLLALSMFGYYELRLPASWQTKLASISHHQATGHYLGAAIMGCLSILILSPCVTPPLIGALSYIAHSGNTFLGILALFFLGLGMGTPLLLIGTSAGKWLPKSGKWMNAVKTFFGVMLLVVAIFLMQRILPSTIGMGLWASLLIFSGIYCGALTRAVSRGAKFGQGVGIILLLYGLLILIGGSMGGSNPLQPLAGFHANLAGPSIHNETVKTVEGVKTALANAKDKPVMLDFYADWCVSCQIMESTVFKDPRVEKALKEFVVVKVDITANNDQEKALLKEFNVVAPPTFLFFNAQGQEQTNLRIVGEKSADEFLQQLDQASTKPRGVDHLDLDQQTIF